jgi:Histidine kinase
MSTPAERIDWSQLWYPGPRREFTSAELARGGGPGPSRTLVVVCAFNAALLCFGLLQLAPASVTARLMALLLAALVGLAAGARALWRMPSRRLLLRWTLGYATVALAVGLAAIQWRIGDPAEKPWVFGACWGAALVASAALWLVASVRAEQIEAALREQDERERRADMARQLAQAQIQPHFLFNSLASLQHWVQAKDDRAAPLLDALMAFLRATLPLFDRRWLRVAEEAQALRQYLAVMRLRLGERLRWQLDVAPGAADALLPPGLLLTLVENAIEHGVQKSLAGADVHVQATVSGQRLTVSVRDSGPGLARDATDGVGLGNARARLAQAFGAGASLSLTPDLADTAAPGTLARIDVPLLTTEP